MGAWIYKAFVLLVSACPCALGDPHQGWLYLEGGGKARSLDLDKKGTITQGNQSRPMYPDYERTRRLAATGSIARQPLGPPVSTAASRYWPEPADGVPVSAVTRPATLLDQRAFQTISIVSH